MKGFGTSHQNRDHTPRQILSEYRSQRISHENLRLRDAAYISRFDKWFTAKAFADAGIPAPAPDAEVPPMFTPFKVRDVVLKNRVVVSPMAQYSAVDGLPADYHLVHLGARAMGGAALVFTEMTCVSADAFRSVTNPNRQSLASGAVLFGSE